MQKAHLAATPAFPARWIAPPHTSLKQFGVFLFRKTISLPAGPASFRIHVSGDNRYQLFVNGQPVLRGPQRSDPRHWRYETIDLAPFLKQGTNLLAAWVWNQGEHLAWAQMSHQTGFWVQGAEPAAAAANTDSTWKVTENKAYTPAASIAHITGPYEQVFAQRYPWGWEQPAFNDSGWEQAITTEQAVVDTGSTAPRILLPRSLPAAEEKPQRFAVIRKAEGTQAGDAFLQGKAPLTIQPWAKVTLLLDQQVLTTAFPEMELSGGKGARITVTYAEALYTGKNDAKGNRNEVEGKTIRGDQDILLPDGGQHRIFKPLWYRTFRYVQVEIENHQEPLVLHDYRSIFTAYPFQENAAFRSSDSSLQHIWNTGWRTSRLCAYETYMDCPYYEQLQYVGDTRIQALISLYVSGDDRLMRNAIEQFHQSFIADGITQSRYPSSLKQVIPPFSLFWISMIHDYWMLRKDDAFVRQFLPAIRSILAWHRQHLNGSNMLGKMPYWNFVDWPDEWPWKGSEELSGIPAGTLEGNSSILTLQYAYALQKAAGLMAAYGLASEAKQYATLKANIARATYAACWNKQKQMLADTPEQKEYSQHASLLAVLTDAVPLQEQAALLRTIEQDSSLIQCTIYYRFYLNQAFKKAGLGNEYIRMLQPWHNMIGMGLTTFAERPEPTRSDCHAWSASPNYDLLATVCGIEPAAPGFAKVRIAPHLGALQWVNASMPHPAGTIMVSLQQKDGQLTGEVRLPKGVPGELKWQGRLLKWTGGTQKVNLTGIQDMGRVR